MSKLAVVIGDPTGIGPEVLAKALAAGLVNDVLLVGDLQVWEEAQRIAQVGVPAKSASRPGPVTREGVPFLEVPVGERSWKLGTMSPAAGRAVAEWLKEAVRLATDGIADAVVFAPLNKQAIIRGGYGVRDEYELIASFVHVDDHDEVNVIPHPAGHGLLWVARATSHVPLRDVPQLLTQHRVLRTIRLAHRVAMAAGAASPRVGVAALNPHAGEDGTLGDEEVRIIRPAVEEAVTDRIDATGPHPADHIFRMARAGKFDAVVAMYHDQAQIATKLLGFDRGVSIGIGYPFITVTPSHGTAFDIAGKDLADPQPMIQALKLADQLVRAGFLPRLG
jgi:4-hydroxythreonine-4-phosphate dehydrogenase